MVEPSASTVNRKWSAMAMDETEKTVEFIHSGFTFGFELCRYIFETKVTKERHETLYSEMLIALREVANGDTVLTEVDADYEALLPSQTAEEKAEFAEIRRQIRANHKAVAEILSRYFPPTPDD
jgi:hypothetical protein